MIARYKPNEMDTGMISEITTYVRLSLDAWYGPGSTLESDIPEIRSYRNSFMLRYPIVTSGAQPKHILVKIRRTPKMESLHEAVHADIHQNVPSEYESLEFVYEGLGRRKENFGALRPLAFIEKYFAIVMEEYPSRTLRQLLNRQRSSRAEQPLCELKDAARKTGRWLYYFHHHMHIPSEQPYTTADVLKEVQDYAERIQFYSRGRVQAQQILQAFSEKLAGIPIHQVAFSQSHADMTCDNVLYSDDKKVCVIDIKTRLAPIYADLGLILIHPDTFRSQIFSGGRYYPESLLRAYRSEIIAGYFEEAPGNEVLARLYSAIKTLDKWLMYEELMNRYKGLKRILAIPAAPFVSAYFHNLMKKYLDLIDAAADRDTQLANTVDSAL